MTRHGEEALLPGLGYSQSQLFWLSGASVWCAKYRDMALKLRVLTGVHSPDIFRVQVMLSSIYRYTLFRKCFKIRLAHYESIKTLL